jgi:GT2 family glycosyltransferase
VDLSVVIPARNVAPTLPTQLDALAAQLWTGSWEVLIVDNRSTDDTPAIAQHYGARDPRFRLVDAHEGTGVSFVRNRGIEAATSAAIAICDGDDVVGPAWVAAMGEALRTHDCVTGPVDVDLLNPSWLTATRGRFPSDRPRTYLGLFEMIAGGNFGIRRDIWKQVGGFDEEFSGPEDADFSLRLRQHGVAIHFVPDAVIHYRYRAEPGALWRQGRFYGRGRPLIAKRVKTSGLGHPPRVANWKSWAALLVWLPRLVTRHGRATYIWVAGNRFGELEGALRHRAFYI